MQAGDEAVKDRGALSWQRAGIAVVAGWVGFALDAYPVDVVFEPHHVSLLLGLVVPLTVALAWGWRVGLLAGTLGLAGQSCWLLWPENGWANVAVAALYTAWFPWHGWLAEERARRPRWWNGLYTGRSSTGSPTSPPSSRRSRR